MINLHKSLLFHFYYGFIVLLCCFGIVFAQIALDNRVNRSSRVPNSKYDNFVYTPAFSGPSALHDLTIYFYSPSAIEMFVGIPGSNEQPSLHSHRFRASSGPNGAGLLTIPSGSIPSKVYLSVRSTAILSNRSDADYSIYIDEKDVRLASLLRRFTVPEAKPDVNRITSNIPHGYQADSIYGYISGDFSVLRPSNDTVWDAGDPGKISVVFYIGRTASVPMYFTVVLESKQVNVSMMYFQGYAKPTDGLVVLKPRTFSFNASNEYRIVVRNSSSFTITSEYFSINAPPITVLDWDTESSVYCPYGRVTYIQTQRISASLQEYRLLASVMSAPVNFPTTAFYIYWTFSKELPNAINSWYYRGVYSNFSELIIIPPLSAEGSVFTIGIESLRATLTPSFSVSFLQSEHIKVDFVEIRTKHALSSLISQYRSALGIIAELDREVSTLLSLPRGLVVMCGQPVFINASATKLLVFILPSASLSVSDAIQLTRPFTARMLFSNISAAVQSLNVSSRQRYPLLFGSQRTVLSIRGMFLAGPNEYIAQCDDYPYDPDPNASRTAPMIGALVSGSIVIIIVIAVYIRRKKARRRYAFDAANGHPQGEDGANLPPRRGGFIDALEEGEVEGEMPNQPAGEPVPMGVEDEDDGIEGTGPEGIEGGQGQSVRDEDEQKVRMPEQPHFFAPAARVQPSLLVQSPAVIISPRRDERPGIEPPRPLSPLLPSQQPPSPPPGQQQPAQRQ